jgi:CRISPR-associated protein Csb1
MGVDFSRKEDGSAQDDPTITQVGRITTLDAPHRIADAIFRDSVLRTGAATLPFRDSPEGRAYEDANIRNATALFALCPTALIFGSWNSTSLRRGSTGSKFARVVVSEIIGINAIVGVRTSSRIDPLGIPSQVQIFDDGKGNWTLEDTGTLVGHASSKTPGRPSLINHGNVTPDVSESGGVTMDYALQTTVISLPGLRRLRFPGPNRDTVEQTLERNIAARTVLCALALAAVAYQRETGCDLRSRCLLVPEESSQSVELVQSGADSQAFTLTATQAATLFTEAVEVAKTSGLPWPEKEVTLWPMAKFVNLIREARRQGPMPEEKEEA